MTDIFQVTTRMGTCITPLPFPSNDRLNNFNSICYSGKTKQGIKINCEDYLNSLNKGEFTVMPTKFDNGDFEEKFIIVRQN